MYWNIGVTGGMELHDSSSEKLFRRSVLGGIGGLGIAFAGLPITAGDESDVLENVEADPHTEDTYRAVVDALIPETPALADELGPEHEPGGLDVDLEQYLIWSFNNSEEIRADGLTAEQLSQLGIDLDEDGLSALIDGVLDGVSSTINPVIETLGFTEVENVFGTLERLTVEVGEGTAETGAANVEFVVETANTSVQGVSKNYPYAPVFPVVFDLVALEFVAQGENEDDVEPNPEFAAGGAFARLSRTDRLRCLEWILDGGVVDRLDEELGDLIGTPGTLKYVVTALHAATTLGYYSEWSGYGATKTDAPSQRSLETPVHQVQSRQQTDYPGLEPGYDDHRGFELNEFRENDY